LEVAALAATLAIVIGTLAGFVLSRYGPFRGRALFSGLIAAPLVIPEIILGFALLLFFILLEQWTGWPEGRGFMTILLAHTTFTAAYVAVIVQSRLVGSDLSLEEAAADLGARPMTVFRTITLPLLSPALISGWLLAFVLSLDDAVLSSFVSGPSSTTMPVLIFSKVRLGVSPEINALATLLIVTVAICLLLASFFIFRKEKRA
jgi:putrescine transport system permease protein